MKVYIDSSDTRWVAPTAAYLGDCALALGLSSGSRDKLVEALEICCGNVIRHAYEPGEPVQYQVIFGDRILQLPETLLKEINHDADATLS